MDYGFWYTGPGDKNYASTLIPFRAKPGETKDLGVVKMEPRGSDPVSRDAQGAKAGTPGLAGTVGRTRGRTQLISDGHAPTPS